MSATIRAGRGDSTTIRLACRTASASDKERGDVAARRFRDDQVPQPPVQPDFQSRDSSSINSS